MTKVSYHSRLRRIAAIVLVNAAVLGVLLVAVELIFGNWVRPMALRDLRRFSIPIDVSYTFDPTVLYPAETHQATYRRDAWGLRGAASSLPAIDVVTVGGSTTDQRYLDDARTWQAVTESELARLGRPLVFTNAGVDGQSTLGHGFSFRYWFPLLDGLRPRVVLFYVGANDVLRGDDRDAYDHSLDATSWRFRSVFFQIYKMVRGNLRAREVGVTHGRLRPRPTDFTEQGLLGDAERAALATRVTTGFLQRVDSLRRDVTAWGAVPIFVTQTAYGWNADRQPPRGMRGEVRLHGVIGNFADVAFVHQFLNRALMQHCAAEAMTCFDLASDVAFDANDYYDPLHNSIAGAEKIGRYLAGQLSGLSLTPRHASRGASP